jgi:glutaredoxin
MPSDRIDARAVGVLIALVLALGGASQWWAQRHDDALGRELARSVRSGDLRMLSSETCIYCARARAWMNARQVPFDECMIERDAACAERYRAAGAPGTPVMLVRGQAQLGFDPERVLRSILPPG